MLCQKPYFHFNFHIALVLFSRMTSSVESSSFYKNVQKIITEKLNIMVTLSYYGVNLCNNLKENYF